MRKLCFVVLLLAVMAGSAFAATVGTWYGSSAGPPYTGSWSDTYWNSARNLGPPAPPGTVGDEVKLTRDDTVCTVNSIVGNCNWTLSIGSVMTGAAARIGIVAGGSIGMKEIRLGAGGTTGTTTITGYLDQTGGTLNVYGDGDIYIGRQGNAAGKIGVGYYTISGGTIVCDATTTTKGGLYVGGASGTEGMNGSIGTFTVVGDDASITMKKLYVGAQTVTRYGTGNLEFKIDAGGVSPIRLTDASSIILDQAGANSTANLVVSLLAAPPSGAIVLVENTSTGAVSGTFDTLNGGSAIEGAPVTLSYGGNNYDYTLTYAGGIGGNDIVLIPEPATLALLGLGSLIAIRRRRK
jgi:hypothetical protein